MQRGFLIRNLSLFANIFWTSSQNTISFYIISIQMDKIWPISIFRFSPNYLHPQSPKMAWNPLFSQILMLVLFLFKGMCYGYSNLIPGCKINQGNSITLSQETVKNVAKIDHFCCVSDILGVYSGPNEHIDVIPLNPCKVSSWGLGHLDLLWTPLPLRLRQKPKFVFFKA